MLIGNYSVLYKSPGNFYGPTGFADNSLNSKDNATFRRVFQNYDSTYSEPTGCEPPYSWLMADMGGGLASYGKIEGIGAISSASLAQGINLISELSGSGTISAAQLSLITSMFATLTGSGTISSATLQTVSSLLASIGGTGTISSADLGAIVQLVSSLSGTGTISSANFVGIESLSANILVDQPTGLTASEVWNFPVEGSYTAEEAIKLILSALAGKLSGAETATVTIRNVQDDKDRIVASVDSNGNRTSVTYDVTD